MTPTRLTTRLATQLAVVLAAGLSASACSHNTSQAQLAPGPLTSSQLACLDYGFPIGSQGFDQCVTREHDARVRGRMAPGYAVSQLTVDARDACYSYGLQPGTASYDRCVSHEVDSRSYREGAAVYAPYSYPPAQNVVYYPSPPAQNVVYYPSPPAQNVVYYPSPTYRE